jgi:hypothetical protein
MQTPLSAFFFLNLLANSYWPNTLIFFFWLVWFFETESRYIAQTGLEFSILLPLPPKCKIIGTCPHAYLPTLYLNTRSCTMFIVHLLHHIAKGVFIRKFIKECGELQERPKKQRTTKHFIQHLHSSNLSDHENP